MAYLIDGHNLIPKIPGLSLRDLDDEEALIELLQVFCQNQKSSVEVYFDGACAGYAGTKMRGNVKVIYVRKGITADAAIIKRLHDLKKAAKNWSVVTSDRSIQVEARACSARVISSEEFSHRLMQAKEPGGGRSPREDYVPDELELEEWLKLFEQKSDESRTIEGKRKKAESKNS